MYNATTPMLLNAIYEITFWSNIQYEHTIVFTETIEDIPSSINNRILEMRKKWRNLNETAVMLRERIGNSYQPYPKSEWCDAVYKLTLEAEIVNQQFLNLLIDLGKHYNDNDTVQLLLNHVYEESQYFTRILATIKKLMSV